LLAGLVAGGNDSNQTYAPGPAHPAGAATAASQPAAKSERPMDQPI
jgi:poly(3-hydroxybutyrate) depolymerase